MTDWDLYWRFERLHRRHAPVDFRRWKRASQRALREMFPAEGVRVLDSTAGLGDHTVNLAELGFRVEACDASAEAREASREAIARAGVAVEVLDARWESLGDELPSRYDLVWNDAIHWIEHEDEMHRALVGIRGALRPSAGGAPGGALVFFFADPDRREPGAGLESLAWDREGTKAHELLWDHETDEGRVTHLRVAIPSDTVLDEHHLWVVRDRAGTHLESTAMRRIYRWDWHAMSEACARAGYREVTGTSFENDKGHRASMCLAWR